MDRVTAYVGLGANVGDADETLAAAVRALAELPGVSLRAVSRLYATAPVGVTDQGEFRNAVVEIDVPAGRTAEAGALDLLVALKSLERAFGRRRRRRWGPRELDLDLLLFGAAELSVERPPAGMSIDFGPPPDGAIEVPPDGRLLVVPHRDAHERLFVLAPLADLAPDLVPPGWDETVEAARRRQERVEGPDAVRPIGTWDPTAGRWSGDGGR